MNQGLKNAIHIGIHRIAQEFERSDVGKKTMKAIDDTAKEAGKKIKELWKKI